MSTTNFPGTPATIGATANVSGGIAPGNLIEPDIDEELFLFNSDDTPLMNLMLRAKRVKVNSPEIDHYMIDEPKAVFLTETKLESTGAYQAVLPLANSDEYSTVPAIPAGTTIIMLANSLYETQKDVEPESTVPQPTRIYLQKRGMNQVVSDYFESQKKRIPFGKAIIAEQAIANFKVQGNRTLWAGRAGKFKIDVPKMGMQYIYTTEGIRWQFKRELQHSGRWTVEKIIALAKMFFTGEDVPKTALLLAGKNLLEEIQCIDFSKHPEIQISSMTNALGWSVTNFHTVFGDIQIKREPTLDRLGWSNSGALIGEDRLVHYVFSTEHRFSDRMEGEEATRNGILIWDALALKGSCHIWIDGEKESEGHAATGIRLWESAEAPEDNSFIYYLLCECPGISPNARTGQLWSHDGTAWRERIGNIEL